MLNLIFALILSTPLTLADCQKQPGKNHNLILENIHIIDVEHGTMTKNMDIVLNGNIISEIMKHKKNRKNRDFQRIDASGKYAIPGLIEGHAHISGNPEKCLTFALRKGVTALRDMGGDGAYLKELQDAILSGELTAPDIFFSAILGGRDLIMNDLRVKLATPPSYALGEAPWARCVEETSRIEQIIKEAKLCGAFGIKMYAHLSADLCLKLSREAKRQGLKVWAHASVIPTSVEDVISADVNVISHASFFLFKKDWDLKRDGSLAFDSAQLHSERLAHIFETMKIKNIRLDPTMAIEQWKVGPIEDKNKADGLLKLVYDVVKAAHDHGIIIVAGTDCPLPRSEDETLMLHKEMETLVHDVGLPPIDVLRAATIRNAEVLGIEKTHGTIEVGKTADIVILENNPLEDMNSIEHVNMVIKNGKLVE